MLNRKPTNVPNPALSETSIPFPDNNSPTTAPKKVPNKIPIGVKKNPIKQPITLPHTAHLLPPFFCA